MHSPATHLFRASSPKFEADRQSFAASHPKEPVAPKEPVEPEKPEELTSLPKNAIGKALYVRSKKYKTAAAKYEKDMDAYEHAKAKYSDDYFKYSGELRFFKQDKEKYDKKLAEFLKEKETVDKALNGIEAAKTK